jgi:tetratricopeptide (TPR) repeat protein
VRELLADAPQSAEGDALELEATVQLLSFGWRQGLEYDEARTLLEQGCELAERTGDLRSRILLQADFITVHTSRGDHAEVADLVEETFALAEQTGDARLRVGLRYVKGMYFFYSGNIVAASALLAETADLGYRELTPTTLVRGLPVAWAHGIRAWVLAEQGKLAESAESARRCEEGIRGIGHLEVESWTMSTLSIGSAFAGDAGSALPLVTRAVELAERVGSNLGRIIGHGRLGSVLLLKSRWSEAITELELALRIGGETVSFRATDAFLLSSLAEAHLGAGDLAGARSCAEQALDRATRKTPLWAIPAHLALGRVILAESGRAGREQIEVALASCEALIERTQALFYEPHVHELRAQLARVLGDEALWTHEMNEALKLHTRMGAKGHAQRVTSMLS